MAILSAEKGGISFKALFLLLLTFLLIHAGLRMAPMYRDAERMKDSMAAKARLAQTLKDEDIVAELAKKAGELGLPLGPDDFQLLRDDESRRMKIRAQWDVEVNFLWGRYVRTFHFEPVVEENYTTRIL